MRSFICVQIAILGVLRYSSFGFCYVMKVYSVWVGGIVFIIMVVLFGNSQFWMLHSYDRVSSLYGKRRDDVCFHVSCASVSSI